MPVFLGVPELPGLPHVSSVCMDSCLRRLQSSCCRIFKSSISRTFRSSMANDRGSWRGWILVVWMCPLVSLKYHTSLQMSWLCLSFLEVLSAMRLQWWASSSTSLQEWKAEAHVSCSCMVQQSARTRAILGHHIMKKGMEAEDRGVRLELGWSLLLAGPSLEGDQDLPYGWWVFTSGWKTGKISSNIAFSSLFAKKYLGSRSGRQFDVITTSCSIACMDAASCPQDLLDLLPV